LDVGQRGAQRFSKHALSPVTLCGNSNGAPGGNPKTRLSTLARKYDQHNKRVGIGFSGLPHPLEIDRTGQTEFAFQPLDNIDPGGKHIFRDLRLTVPIGPLGVIIPFHSQAIAAFQAAAFEDFTTAGRGHTLAKAMHAHPAADFGLVSSLWHTCF
jgi:hypothetical protein